MLERFTERAKRVTQLVDHQALRFALEYVDTEQILLGLAQAGSGVAANVLKNLNVNLSDIRRAVEELVTTGSGIGDTKGNLRSTPTAHRVVEYAIAASRELNHNHIGSEHLLLGLLREQNGIAAKALANLEVTLDRTKTEILDSYCRR